MIEAGAVASAVRDGVPDASVQHVCGECAHFVRCSIRRCGRSYWDVGVCAVRMARWADGRAEMSECGRVDTDGLECPDWREDG